MIGVLKTEIPPPRPHRPRARRVLWIWRTTFKKRGYNDTRRVGLQSGSDAGVHRHRAVRHCSRGYDQHRPPCPCKKCVDRPRKRRREGAAHCARRWRRLAGRCGRGVPDGRTRHRRHEGTREAARRHPRRGLFSAAAFAFARPSPSATSPPVLALRAGKGGSMSEDRQKAASFPAVSGFGKCDAGGSVRQATGNHRGKHCAFSSQMTRIS